MAFNMAHAQSQPAAAAETGGVHHSLHNVEGAMNALRSLHQLLVSRFVAIHGSSACDTLLTETNKLRHDILHEMELLQSAPSSSAPRRRSPHQQYDQDDEERFLAEEEEEDEEHDEGVEYDPDDLAETMEGKGKFFAPPLPPALVAMIPRRTIAAPTHHTSLVGGEPAAAVVCAVCQEDLGEGHVLLTLPVCNHEFCEVCAVEWLAICGSCPSCRRVIEPEDVTLLMEANCVLSARGGGGGDMGDDDDDEHAEEPDDLTGNNGSAAANRTLSHQQTPPPSTTTSQQAAVTVKEVQLHTEQQLQLSKAAQALLQSRANPSMATPVAAGGGGGSDGLLLRARPGSGGGRQSQQNNVSIMTVPPPSSLYSRTQPPPLMMSISSIRSTSTTAQNTGSTGSTSAATGVSTTMTTESANASRFQPSSSSTTTVTGAASSGSASSPSRREGQASNSGLQLGRVAAQRRPQSAASSSLHGAAPMTTASFLMQGRQVERPSSAIPSKNQPTGEAAKSSEEGSSVPPLHEPHKAVDSVKDGSNNKNNNSRGPLHTRPMSAPTRSATTSPVPMSSLSPLAEGDAQSSSSHPQISLKQKSTVSSTTTGVTARDEITVPTTVPSATSGGNFARTQANEDERADGRSSSQQAPLPRPQQQQRPASSGALRVAAVRTVATFQGWDSAKPHTRLLQPSDATLCSTASIMHRSNSAGVTSVGGRPSTAGSGTHPSYSSSSSFVTKMTDGGDPRPLNAKPFFGGGGGGGGHNVGSPSSSSTVAALLRPSSSSTSLWTTPFVSNAFTTTTLSNQKNNNTNSNNNRAARGGGLHDGGDGGGDGAVTIGSTRWSPVAARIQSQRSARKGTNNDNMLSPSAAGSGGDRGSHTDGGNKREEEVLRFSILGPRVPNGGVSSQSLLTRPSSSPSLRVAVGNGGRLNSSKKAHANTQPLPPPSYPMLPPSSSAAISLRGAAANGNGAGLLCVDGKSWERQKFKKSL